MRNCYDLSPDDCRRVPVPGPSATLPRASVGVAGVWIVGVIGVISLTLMAFAALSPVGPMPCIPATNQAAEARAAEADAARFVAEADRNARAVRARTAFDPTPTPTRPPPLFVYTGSR